MYSNQNKAYGLTERQRRLIDVSAFFIVLGVFSLFVYGIYSFMLFITGGHP